ncbi:MAG TPA: HutD family protein [Steroidobacteraceae bacterium]|nr:HutD family protein [Steroidobacteraceae bacterium]
MRLLREIDSAPVPWKNGGGLTREILREPTGEGVFDWRLSVATIDTAGPFSSFDGYDRTLVLVRGAGVELTFAGHGSSRLTAPGQQVAFDGGWSTQCALLGGPSSDLNLMSARERVICETRCVALAGVERVLTAGWSETLVCCVSGAINLTNNAGEALRLEVVDTARCSAADGELVCRNLGNRPACLFVARLTRREREG